MLARKHKLDPATLFARPHRTLRGDYMTVAHAPAQGKEGAFAVIIPAKAARSAVLRHRMKRVLFAALAAKLPCPRDAVISLRRVPQEDAGPALRAELEGLLERIPH